MTATKIEQTEEIMIEAGIEVADREKIAADYRKDAVQDVLIDLADWLKDAPADKIAGLKMAISIIKENYNH